MLYADTSTSLNKLSSAAQGNALVSSGVGVPNVFGKVDLSIHTSGVLSANRVDTGSAVTLTGNRPLVSDGDGGFFK